MKLGWQALGGWNLLEIKNSIQTTNKQICLSSTKNCLHNILGERKNMTYRCDG
jgi:hypothetical protein